MLNSEELYDNAVQPDNVYGHTLALLEQFRDLNPEIQGIHLDLGCGFGRIAEPIRDRIGLTYIGIDGAAHGPQSLRERGFEAHQLLFGSYEAIVADVKAIIGDRPIRSLSMLDTLEHLPETEDILRAIRELIRETNAAAVISVPNVAHRDMGLKLAFGQWDYTRDGLLDHTHVRLFNAASLRRTLNSAGLQIVGEKDVRITVSDQNFPRSHPALATGTSLHKALAHIRGGVDDTGAVNQFVKLVIAGPHNAEGKYVSDSERNPKRPFLSLVMRTQGTRLHCLNEALTCLAGQKDRDFEVLVMGHKLTIERQMAVERQLDDSPSWLRDKIKLIKVDDGNRTRPLNLGFEAASGDYVAILDEDDIPLAHWVSTFRDLAAANPGTVLRAIAARQEVESVTVNGSRGVRATGEFKPYSSRFELIPHLDVNQSPPIALAFPRGVFHDLNIRFDESLSTTEDWDFLMRCAVVVGVSSAEEITSIYNWWGSADSSSRTDHQQAEWDLNYAVIQQKLNDLPIILPPGNAGHLRQMHLALYQPHLVGNRRTMLLKEIATILTSRSWRWTAIFRLPRKLSGKRSIKMVRCFEMSENKLEATLAKLKRSGSWRKTKAFRKSRKKAT